MIYLDGNATTPPDPAVVEAMTECLRQSWGNPSSLHLAGQAARGTLERSRRRVAQLIGAQPDEIVFTSGGTEADNQVLAGWTSAGGPRHVVTTAIEHQALLAPCQRLEAAGGRVTRVPAGRDGVVDPAAVAAALAPDTALVSVMLANNETGVLQPVAEIARLAHARGIPVHTDAVQAVGRLPVDVVALGVDCLSLSAHKFHGPKGVGALFARRGAALAPLLVGGHQESRRRAGTENLPGIAGLGRACELALARLAEDPPRLAALRDRLQQLLSDACPGLVVNGGGVPRLANTLNVSFPGVDAQALAMNLDLLGFCVSTGSACATASREPSHVLTAMGCGPELAAGALR
ncbi:MAG: cysteine desulfurase family protein, partial [Lentisphaeria bacterium]